MGYYIVDKNTDKLVQWVAELRYSGTYSEDDHFYVEGDYQENMKYEDGAIIVDDTAVLEAQANTVRRERNELLAATDHFALQDVTMTDAMRDYRQALRDVPQNDGFPQTVVWPVLGGTE